MTGEFGLHVHNVDMTFQFIKKAGIWEEVSGLNLARLQKFLDDEELDKKNKNGLLKFAEEIEKTSVRLVKKREEEE